MTASGSNRMSFLRLSRTILLVCITVICLYQIKVSVSVEKRLISSNENADPTALLSPTKTKKNALPATLKHSNNNTHTKNNNETMSACLLVMDDTIKLTEWLAYHYTVMPLSHLIVAIDPHSVLTEEIQDVLRLWKPHLTHLEVWTNDTWMILAPQEGWPPISYNRQGKLIQKRIQRVPKLEHKRRQEHFSIQCMRRLKTLEHAQHSWVAHLDTDEFLLYNYLSSDEDSNYFLSNTSGYQRMVKGLRRNRLPIRQQLPMLLGEDDETTTIASFLAHTPVKPCIKIPGLQISAHESHLQNVTDNVPIGIDARLFMTLRHFHHGNKHGKFTKCILNLKRIPLSVIQQEYVRTIHNPLGNVCGMHAESFIGMDYIASILRIHHYAGTVESFQQRQFDARRNRNKESFGQRNVKSMGITTDIRPWVTSFVHKMGKKEALRLLEPLVHAYRDTDWSAVWDEHGDPVVVGQ